MRYRRGFQFLIFLVLSLFLVMLSSCSGVSTHVESSKTNVNKILKYHGPRARIAVASFRCKAAKCGGGIGDGLADMLTTALFRTGRFIVLERGEGLRAIQQEINLAKSGYVQFNQAAHKGSLEGADILVVGTITAFEPEASGVGVGGIAIPFKVPLIGGISLKKKEAYIAADIRLIDVRTGRIIAVATVEGKSSQWKVGTGGAGLFGNMALAGGLSVYKNTPMEKAIRVMIEKAVQTIAKLVPENYYRYSANGQPVKPVSSSQQNQPVQANVSPKTQISGGGIVGGEQETFVPGKKVLFAEDFSNYNIGDTPTCFDSLKGSVEVAAFRGKKWMRALSDRVIAVKKIKLPENFAVEWDIYFSKSASGMGHAVFLGNLRNAGFPDVLWWASDWKYPRWSGKEIKTIKIHAGEIHHFAIQQKDGKIKIFVDGVKIHQEPVRGGIVGGVQPNRDAITIDMDGANPSEGREILITNIKVTEY